MRDQSRQDEFEEQALVHLDRVFNLAVRLAGNRATAEDLVQETYLKAFRHFDRFDPGSNCRAWLFAILRNTFINQMKRHGREIPGLAERDLEQAEVGMPETVRTIENPEEALLRRVVDSDLVAALDRLPLAFREVVLLADVEECSYREIAQICGVPMGTVMSRLSRARRLLRQTLELRVRGGLGLGRMP